MGLSTANSSETQQSAPFIQQQIRHSRCLWLQVATGFAFVPLQSIQKRDDDATMI
jgi:hypothetical protein